MKKKITISIEEEDFKTLKFANYNISRLVSGLISDFTQMFNKKIAKSMEFHTPKTEEKPKELTKEEMEILNG